MVFEDFLLTVHLVVHLDKLFFVLDVCVSDYSNFCFTVYIGLKLGT